MKKPALLLACTLLAGCETTDGLPNYQTLGTVVGGAGCAALGWVLGEGTQLGRQNSALLGGLACAIAGSALGQWKRFSRDFI